jgi:aminopeptidase N
MSSASTLGTMGIACALALGNGSCAHAARTPKIDVQHVAIELRFDEAARQAIGEARLTLAPLAATPEVRLDAVRLAIESVQLEGGAALPFTLDPTAEDEALAIRLPRTWAAGERLALTIRYRTGWVNTTNPAATWGSNGRGLRFLAPSHGDPLRPRQIWPGNEPGSARRWFPGHDVPGDLRTSEFTATVPRPLGVAAGGRRVQVRDNADGTRTYRFRTDVPEPNQRSTFVVGEFAEITQQAGPVTLTSLGYPHERAGVEASVGMLPAMVAHFSQWLDEPFPHRGYTQVFVPELPWHTLGTGIAINTENMVDDFGTHADFHYLWHGLQAESLLQQWFGGLVAPCAAHEAWLERGLAHHLAGLWTEHLHGRAEFLLWYAQADQATAIADWQQGTRESLAEPAPPDLAAFVNGNTPYARAGAVLHMLRQQLGDARWREALRHFVRTNRGRLVCSAALQRSVEAAGGESFDGFFRQWVHGRGHPVFEVAHVHDAARGRLVLTVKQVQADPAPLFAGPLELQIDGRIERVRIEARAENRFEFAAAQAPRLVVFDREGGWLKELRHAKPLSEWLHQVRASDDAAARQAALVELARRYREADTGAADRETIVEALREAAAAPRYWRERFNALGQLATLLGGAPPSGPSASATPAAPAAPVALPPALERTLLDIVRDEGSWLRTAALRVLGLTRSERHVPLYLEALTDTSDRVVNAAAIALGRSGSARAFDALAALPRRPSWKNQSLISALAGLQELRDPRGVPIALAALADRHAARWTLATPIWDFRLAAAQLIAAIGRREEVAQAHDSVAARLEHALAGAQVHDLFSDLPLLALLGDERSRGLFERARSFARGDERMLKAVDTHAQALEQRLLSGR